MGLSFPLDSLEIVEILIRTFCQAFLSSALSVFLGLCLCLSLHGLKSSKRRKSLFLLFLLPGFISPFFLSMGFVGLFPQWKGLVPLLYLHVFMNIGFVALTLSSLLKETVLPYNDLCLVEGVPLHRRLLSTFRLWGPQSSRLFMTVFMFCFLSFMIPLFVGGHHWATLEVALYEKIKIKGDWNEGIALALTQMSVLFLFSFAITRVPEFKNLELLSKGKVRGLSLSRKYLFAFLAFLAVPFVGLLKPLISDWSFFFSSMMTSPEVVKALWNSLLISGATGILFVAVFQCFLVLPLPSIVLRLFSHLSSAPLVFIGFALFFMGPPSFGLGVSKIVWGFFLVFFPISLRMYLNSAIEELRSHREVSEIYGVHGWSYWKQVVLPLHGPKSFLYGGIISFWVIGDFTLPSLIFLRHEVLAQKVQELFGNYKFVAAGQMNMVLLLTGCILLGLFLGVSYALHKKFGVKKR